MHIYKTHTQLLYNISYFVTINIKISTPPKPPRKLLQIFPKTNRIFPHLFIIPA